jgi:hypothetical protein
MIGLLLQPLAASKKEFKILNYFLRAAKHSQNVCEDWKSAFSLRADYIYADYMSLYSLRAG